MIGPEPGSGKGKRLRLSDTILVALDGSLLAQAAASIAIQLAQAEDLAIRGLYVVDERLVMDPYANPDRELGSSNVRFSRPDLIARFRERGEAALNWLEASCREARIAVSADLLLGAVPELVIEAAREAELVALGRRGRPHESDAAHLGRNLRAVVHHVPCPVLVGGDDRRPIARLLVVYDPSRRNQPALAWASIFQRMLLDPPVVLAPGRDRAASHGGPSTSDLGARLEANGLLGCQLLARRGDLQADIIAAATEFNVNLIVLGQRRHAVWSRSTVGPALDGILRQTPMPVLLA